MQIVKEAPLLCCAPTSAHQFIAANKRLYMTMLDSTVRYMKAK